MRRSRTPTLLLLAAAFVASTVACRSKIIKADGQDVGDNFDKLDKQGPEAGTGPSPASGTTPPAGPAPGPTPAAAPIEVPDGLTGRRVRYQTRNVIEVAVSDALADANDAISIYNATTETRLVELSHATTLDDTTERGFRFDPKDADLENAFTYGDNVLRVATLGAGPIRFSTRTIERRDFPVFGVGVLAAPAAGGGRSAELELLPYAKPVLGNGRRLLILGTGNMINR